MIKYLKNSTNEEVQSLKYLSSWYLHQLGDIALNPYLVWEGCWAKENMFAYVSRWQ